MTADEIWALSYSKYSSIALRRQSNNTIFLNTIDFENQPPSAAEENNGIYASLHLF